MSEFEWAPLEHSELSVFVHKPAACAGEICAFHNRSDHGMRGCKQLWRGDRGIVERLCECGVAHPDFDMMTYFRRIGKGEAGYGIHGCCAAGCCRRGRSSMGER